jgi:hypothetical protein
MSFSFAPTVAEVIGPLTRRSLDETQFDDLECRDLLHGRCASHRYGLAALHLGLRAGQKGLAYIVKRLHCWVRDMLSDFERF